MSKRKVWIGNWLPLLVFIFVVLFSCYTAYYFAYHITDSDAARELELGKLLADENKLVTSNWYYSTEIRFFGTNLVYMPLFKILQNWPLIRFLSIIIFQLLLLISYLYFSRCVKLSWRAYFISAALLLLPTGVVYGRIVLYQNYYIPCLVYGFLIAGLSLAILEHHGQHKRMRQGLRVAAMIVLSFISCLNGFRQFTRHDGSPAGDCHHGFAAKTSGEGSVDKRFSKEKQASYRAGMRRLPGRCCGAFDSHPRFAAIFVIQADEPNGIFFGVTGGHP